METILIIIHLMIVIALVVVVLLQRSEGGALGIGGGGGGLMSARGAANALTRTTGILAAAFFITSLSLGLLARYGSQPTDILDQLPASQTGSQGTGSLLDQLGGLPGDGDTSSGPDGEGQGPVEAPSGDAPEPLSPPTGNEATTQPDGALGGAAGGDGSAPTGDASDGARPAIEPGEGSAQTSSEPVETVPANPGQSAPNAADEVTVPPVEPPPAGIERPASSDSPQPPQ